MNCPSRINITFNICRISSNLSIYYTKFAVICIQIFTRNGCIRYDISLRMYRACCNISFNVSGITRYFAVNYTEFAVICIQIFTRNGCIRYDISLRMYRACCNISFNVSGITRYFAVNYTEFAVICIQIFTRNGCIRYDISLRMYRACCNISFNVCRTSSNSISIYNFSLHRSIFYRKFLILCHKICSCYSPVSYNIRSSMNAMQINVLSIQRSCNIFARCIHVNRCNSGRSRFTDRTS